MKDTLEDIYRIAFNAINQIDDCKRTQKEIDVNSLRKAFKTIVMKICKESQLEEGKKE